VIESDCVMSLSLILNELATNGLKYGGLGGDTQHSIEARICDGTGDLQIKWAERLTALRSEISADPERAGFGSQHL
jgi:two-component sensor histidine kinase